MVTPLLSPFDQGSAGLISPDSLPGGMPPPPPKRPARSPPMAAEGAWKPSAESMETDDRDPAKRYKKLQKKLREIQKLELSERRDWLLNPEERAKLESREMLEVELIALRARADLVHPELADSKVPHLADASSPANP